MSRRVGETDCVSSPGGGGIDSEWVIRDAVSADVMRICEFGDAHIREHYAPLIGDDAAAQQVSDWWNPSQIGAATAEGLIVIAETAEGIIGVAQRGLNGSDHVLYKLYLDGRRAHATAVRQPCRAGPRPSS